MRKIIPILMLLSLAGCMGTRWQHATMEEAYRPPPSQAAQREDIAVELVNGILTSMLHAASR